MRASRYRSWGGYPKFPQDAARLAWQDQAWPDSKPLLPFGNGRSYGDVCLNENGLLLDARPLDRFLAFDENSGVLRCEAGVLLSEVLRFCVPKGWFLPVTPGTQFVTLGGAVANDVHGKNHHCGGTFGCHTRAFELLRSDGTRRVCSPTQNAEWFNATVGGLGLTGLMTWVEIQLKRIPGPYIHQQVRRYRDLGEFFAITAESEQDYEYTVAWLDCLGSGKGLGRGLFMRGNHAQTPRRPAGKEKRIGVPLEPPLSLINPLSLRLFNLLYYYRQGNTWRDALVDYEPFFYPLDAIDDWNRIYGPRGFLQFQCVVPMEQGEDAIREILRRIAASGAGSFLAVLKVFGAQASPGLLSFPRPGVTVALDFPNHGSKTFALLERLEEITTTAGGAIYPAKDARMSGAHFRGYFPAWQEFSAYLDPAFSSSFWRRVA